MNARAEGKSTMQKEPVTQLTWQGSDTATAISGMLNETEKIEIKLPLDFNHALFQVLHPDAPPSGAETIDADAGPELLEKIASITQLEPFSQVATALKDNSARVKIISPPKVIIYDLSAHRG